MSELGPPVKIAVVGAGYWGPNLVRNLHELSQASLEVVCDLRPDALARIARRYPGLRTTTSYADVLADDAIEAVAIATQVGTHAELATAALEAGKHVLVEKPLAASVAEAESLIELAGRRAASGGRVPARTSYATRLSALSSSSMPGARRLFPIRSACVASRATS